MPGKKTSNFDLFKAAMGNQEELPLINTNTATQTDFLTMLQEGHVTFKKIQESIQIVPDKKVKSLLIIHLLSQQDYLDALNGTSVLHRLNVRDNHIPSRLNALIHQLDVTTLTSEMISKLEPEAAVSILCSVPHFHQLTQEQINSLIEKYKKHELIVYWLNHFASMPNAHYLLAHLMKIAGDNIIDELSKMELSQKEAFIANTIKHFDLYSYIPKRFFEHANKESHLALAARLYLNGHYNQLLAAYINRLAKKLLTTNQSFSPTTIELFFFLNDKLAFKDLSTQWYFLTNHYLRNKAQEGSVSLFYQENQINLSRMTQEIHLSPIPAEPVTEQQQIEPATENSFVNDFIKHNKSMNCLEYFLIHYQGESAPIRQLLPHYLNYYKQIKNLKSRAQALHSLSFMLTCAELDRSVKEAIFTTFLDYPFLWDEHISYQLILFDAKRALCSLSLRGGQEDYQKVIELCQLALKNLDSQKNPDIIQIAQKTLSEAKMELSFTQNRGFFSGFIQWIKRCWTYGWSGFFKPNPPKYITPESWFIKKPPKKSVKNLSFTELFEKDLLTQLKEITEPLTQQTFERIMNSLEHYSLQRSPKQELETRQKIQDLYHTALGNKEEKPALYRWLKENQTPFITNQFRLLELLIQNNSPDNDQQDSINCLLGQINEDSDPLQYISKELHCLMPELVRTAFSTPMDSQKKSDFLAYTAKFVTKCATEISDFAQTAVNFAGSFFSKIGANSHEEEEPFDVEHVPTFHPSKNQ